MGRISIQMTGSFPERSKVVSALEGGHTLAISRAIEFLLNQMQWAIQRDHELHERGEYPPNSNFGEVV